ncbi:hypothetical protein U1Q18_031032 [Sarracenia purpurea var. burkii]
MEFFQRWKFGRDCFKMVKRLIKDPKARKLAYKKRLACIKKKTRELATLCDIKTCTIYLGPDGEVDSWPENPTDVKTIINMYRDHCEPDEIYANLNERIKKNERVEREIRAAEEENSKKVSRLIRAMADVLNAAVERFALASGESNAKVNEIDFIGKPPDPSRTGVNPRVLDALKLLFGSIFVNLMRSVGPTSNPPSHSEDCDG